MRRTSQLLLGRTSPISVIHAQSTIDRRDRPIRHTPLCNESLPVPLAAQGPAA
jgi:hypothetical protein